MGGVGGFLSRQSGANYRGCIRFDGDRGNRLATGVFDVAGDTCECAAGTDTADQNVDFAVGILPDFRTGGMFFSADPQNTG